MSYREEVDILWKGFNQQTAEYHKILDRESACIRVATRDSPLLEIRRQEFKRFNYRLLLLSEKYGMLTPEKVARLAGFSDSEKFDEEMYEVAQWFKGRVLECLDAVERGELSSEKLIGAFRMEDYNELLRRERALREKYGAKLPLRALNAREGVF